ncbi:SPFH domain / Band 7 family protein [compost metagenome]
MWDGDSSFVGESQDSIKFKQGMSATAQILEEDTATYLYQYSGKSLKDVMDSEIRNKIGSVLLEKYSTLSIDELRGDKGAVIKAVRAEVEPYFKQRGITLSNLGYVNDIAYLSEDVQEAINKKFKAEQDQAANAVVNKTNLDRSTNEVAVATKESEAAAKRQATMETQLELKRLENEAAWIEALASGKVTLPSTLVQGQGATMLNIPAVGKPTDEK